MFDAVNWPTEIAQKLRLEILTCFRGFFSVPPGKSRYGTLNQATAASIHIISS